MQAAIQYAHVCPILQVRSLPSPPDSISHRREVWTVKQTARDIRIRMDIKDDQLGDRVLDFEALLDGKEHKQTVIGTPASVSASFDGAALFLDIARQARRISSCIPGGDSSSLAEGNGLSHAPHNIHLHRS
jgi:hypothetical protein